MTPTNLQFALRDQFQINGTKALHIMTPTNLKNTYKEQK